jgi:hypothetical protein
MASLLIIAVRAGDRRHRDGCRSAGPVIEARLSRSVTERRRVGRCDKGMAGRREGRIPPSSPYLPSSPGHQVVSESSQGTPTDRASRSSGGCSRFRPTSTTVPHATLGSGRISSRSFGHQERHDGPTDHSNRRTVTGSRNPGSGQLVEQRFRLDEVASDLLVVRLLGYRPTIDDHAAARDSHRGDDRGDQSGKIKRKGVFALRVPAIRPTRLPARRPFRKDGEGARHHLYPGSVGEEGILPI